MTFGVATSAAPENGLRQAGADTGRTYKIRTCDQRIKSPLLYQLS